MGNNNNNGNKEDKFYFFKVDKDKIKLQLKDIGSKIVKKKNRRKTIPIIITFCLLIGIGIAIYNSSTEYPNITIEPDVQKQADTGSNSLQLNEQSLSLDVEELDSPGQSKAESSNRVTVSNPENLGNTGNNPGNTVNQGNAGGNTGSSNANTGSNTNPTASSDKANIESQGNTNRRGTNEQEEGVVTAPVYDITRLQADSNTDKISLLRPVSGEVIREPGWFFHPVFEDWRYQQGIEIAGNQGNIVMAAESGKVLSVRNDEYKGLTVTIQHNNKWKTLYGHLQRTAVEEGEVVGKGQEVGRIGQTGVTERPALYFELLNGEDAVDPVECFE